MLLRVLLTLAAMTVTASAFHEHTFAVFELREHLLMLTMNLWELLEQLEYAHPGLRARVYQEIHMIQREIRPGHPGADAPGPTATPHTRITTGCKKTRTAEIKGSTTPRGLL